MTLLLFTCVCVSECDAVHNKNYEQRQEEEEVHCRHDFISVYLFKEVKAQYDACRSGAFRDCFCAGSYEREKIVCSCFSSMRVWSGAGVVSNKYVLFYLVARWASDWTIIHHSN